MDDETNTTNTNTGMNTTSNTTPTPPPSPVMGSQKSNKSMVWVLVVIIVLALGSVGGYFFGQMTKSQELETAKQTAKQEGHQQAKAEAEKKAKAPAKVVTEPTCNADELSLATAESAESNAGTIAFDIVFTNISERTCTLGGFPGVSLVNNNGNQTGSPAERAPNYEEKTLTVAPNGKVMATVFTTDEADYPAGECKDGATKLRVYPPNDTGYLSVATTTTAWCPGFIVSPVTEM